MKLLVVFTSLFYYADGFLSPSLGIPPTIGRQAFPLHLRVLPLPKDQRPLTLREFLMSHIFQTGIDVNHGNDRVVDGFLNIRNPQNPRKLWDMKGFIRTTANHLWYHWGHLIRPVNRYNLTEPAVAQLTLNPFLRRLRGMAQKRPLVILPKDFIPVRCKAPICNPYIQTVAFALEHEPGNDFALNGLIDFPIEGHDPEVQLRFPLGGTIISERIPVRLVYGHHLAGVNPFRRIWKAEKRLLTKDDYVSKKA
uniref:Uncharacterized protein n=1 Tax=Trichuris muris TaxID=70415 RepID=A0A5S6QHM0_TRIMR